MTDETVSGGVLTTGESEVMTPLGLLLDKSGERDWERRVIELVPCRQVEGRRPLWCSNALMHRPMKWLIPWRPPSLLSSLSKSAFSCHTSAHESLRSRSNCPILAQPTGSAYKNELLGHQPSCVRPLIAWTVPVLPRSGGGGDVGSCEQRRQ